MNATNSLDFVPFDKEQLASYVSTRAGETKLGESIQLSISETTRFIILGIAEDIGPRANFGNAGAKNAFDAFLSKFLNMQSNRFLTGESIALLGTIHALSDTGDVMELRKKIATLDDFVIEILSKIDFTNKHLIVIGGGHNNAYPIMKALSMQRPALHILNIDPHADCRPLEGRHSGNPFSTAIMEKMIDSYSVFGLHEQYNSAAIYQFLEENQCSTTFFEDYLDGRQLSDDLSNFMHEKGSGFGLEIDLDSIEYMPTSAFTPSGFTLNEIRSAVRQLASKKPIYLHLPEGAPKTNEEKTTVGKALAYLVGDFIKSVTK